MRATITGLVVAASSIFATASQAVPVFTLTGGSPFADAANDFLWIDSDVIEGGTLGVSEPARVKIEYIGKEAGYAYTEFHFGTLGPPGGRLIATTNSGLPVTEGSTSASPYPPPGIARDLAPFRTAGYSGMLPFYFEIPANGGAIVPNGAEPGPDSMGDIAFWWKTDSGDLEDVVYVLLDDSGGFNPGEPSDNDHDDMIMRLTLLPVPEPGTATLAAVSLTALGAATRRGRRAARRT